jgi:hypothetical protein
MARKTETQSKGTGRLRKAVGAVKRAFTRGRRAAAETVETVEAKASPAQPARARKAAPKAARPAVRQADIPLDVLDAAYTPPNTSSKAGFRSDGADHQRDQEFSRGVADADWNDEDHFTNKSGDPRIGTRRRTYEPNENRADSRDEQR